MTKRSLKEGRWDTRHHVAPSRCNNAAPKGTRAYFGFPCKFEEQFSNFGIGDLVPVTGPLPLRMNDCNKWSWTRDPDEVKRTKPWWKQGLKSLRNLEKRVGVYVEAAHHKQKNWLVRYTINDNSDDLPVNNLECATAIFTLEHADLARGTSEIESNLPKSTSAVEDGEGVISQSQPFGDEVPQVWKPPDLEKFRTSIIVRALPKKAPGRASTSCADRKNSQPSTSPTSAPASPKPVGATTGFQCKESAMTDEFCVFTQWVTEKQKNLVSLWHKLDTDRNMILHKREFTQGMLKLRYKGTVDILWKLLDRDTTGNISFFEFAPQAALELTRFKKWVNRQFGSVKVLLSAFDANRSNSLTFKEFEEGCSKYELPESLNGAIQTLFGFLQQADTVSKKGMIYQDDLNFIDNWRPPAYLLQDPDFEAWRKFKNAIVEKHGGNAWLAWRRCLDRDSSMRVNYEEFVLQCQVLKKKGYAEAAPANGVAAMYVAFDRDQSGWFTLKDWDETANELLTTFAQYCRREFGTMANFWKNAEKQKADDGEASPNRGGSNGLSFRDFSQLLKTTGLSPSQRLQIFEGLQSPVKKSPSDAGRLKLADVGFLSAWDPDKDAADDDVWGNLQKKYFLSET